MYSLEQWVTLQSGGPAQYKDQQKGSGYVTLCSDCNNRRGGAWNVTEFCLWTKTASVLISKFPEGKTVEEASFVPKKPLKPLPFTKQIVSMMLALNLPEFGETYPELRAFVMDKERTGLPDDHRLYLSLCDLPFARWVGRYDFIGFPLAGGMETVVASQLSYFPFTYVLGIGPPIRLGSLLDITDFTRRPRSDVFAEKMTLPVNGSFLPFDIP